MKKFHPQSKKELKKYMSSSSLYKFLLSFSFLFLISCQSIEKVIEETLSNEENIPEIKNIESINTISLGSSISINNFEKKISLEGFKLNEKNQYKLRTFFYQNKFYTLNHKSELFINNPKDGELIESYPLLNIEDNDTLVSNYLLNNFFILGYSSGKILKVNFNGDIIWSFERKKIFNSFFYEIEGVIIVFYGDQIIALNSMNGEILWAEIYENLPIIQAKGGQLKNFFNDIYFVLPNGRIGLVDFNLGEKNINQFVNLNLQNSINNANDKLDLYNNYILYLDEGEFLHVYDLLTDKFLLNNFKINTSSSNYFFNNALIIKNDEYLEAINILNGNSFWLIESNLSKKSKILDVLNLRGKIHVFLDNGKVAVVYNDIIDEVIDLKIKNINSLHHDNDYIIIMQENGKIVVY